MKSWDPKLAAVLGPGPSNKCTGASHPTRLVSFAARGRPGPARALLNTSDRRTDVKPSLHAATGRLPGLHVKEVTGEIGVGWTSCDSQVVRDSQGRKSV